MFGATLNVGHCHRPRKTLTQLWFKASCGYCQHASTASMKYWLGLNDYWQVGDGLYSHPAVCTARPAAQQTRGVEPVLVRRWARIGQALGQHLVFAGSVDRPHCVSHIAGCEDIKTVAQLIEPKDDFVTVDMRNGFHHIKIQSLLSKGAI